MSKVRTRILEVASELFYQQGIKAVGVDAIISKAEVARMSFYRHFTSKEGLVLAFIRGRDAEFRSWLAAQVERLAPDLHDRPLAVFDALAVRLATPGYRGCAFINTMVETADRNDLAHLAAANHKARFEEYLAGLLSDAGLDPHHAADLLLLFDGAVVAAVREGSVEPAKRARRLAALLLADARLPRLNKSPPAMEAE
jgi:AcrR family transcriptional regulator